LAFFDLEEISSPAGGAAFTEKEGLHKERVLIRALADYVLRQVIGVNLMNYE